MRTQQDSGEIRGVGWNTSINVCPVFHQGGNSPGTAVTYCDHQWAEGVQVRVCTRLHQRFHHPCIAGRHRGVQSCGPVVMEHGGAFVRQSGVYIGTGADQERHNIFMVELGCQMQRCDPTLPDLGSAGDRQQQGDSPGKGKITKSRSEFVP